MERREFLRNGFFTGSGLFIAGGAFSDSLLASEESRKTSASGPMILATYRPGQAVCERGYEILARGGDAVSAVEEGVKIAEADPGNGTVGYGGRPNRDGVVELDAAIMDGSNLEAGSVAAVQNIKHPITVARMVMEKTKHVMLVGDGARQFAVSQGIEEQDLLTDGSREAWRKWQAKQAPAKKVDEENHDTMAAVALDRHGNLGAACTTSGAAYKLPGRVGDSPLIGPGVYCDNGAGGAAGTGLGEEIIKVCGSYQVVEFMRQGITPEEAIRRVLERVVARDKANRKTFVAFIAVRADGEIGLGCTRGGFSAALARGGEIEMIPSPRLDAPARSGR